MGEPPVTGPVAATSPVPEPPVVPAAGGDPAPSGRPTTGPTLPVRRAVLLHGSVVTAFVALGVVLWWRVWFTGHPTTTLTCQCGDPSQELWFLTWTPWAIVHGHSPFLTQAIFAGRGGANMMVNTSWMLPSLVLAPVTWLFGPVASFNVAATLAPAVSGWCFFVAARRLTTFVPGQVLGALLYGFSPFLLQNDPFGHLDFTLLFFPPLAVLLLHDLLVTRRRRPVELGVLAGLLVVAEFFTSTELLAMCALVLAVAVAVAAALALRAARARWRAVLVATGTAAGVAGVALAYPLWLVLAGPRRVSGFPWPNAPQLGTAPGAVVDAGPGVHAASVFDRVGGYFGAVGPNAGPLHLPSGVFLGVLLVGFLAVSAVTWYRSRLAWVVVAATAAAWVFSFGTTLGTEAAPAGVQVHPWWLPWRLFAHVPLVSDILPIRFGGLVMFGGALLLTLSLDGWHRLLAARGPRAPAGGSPDRRRARVVAAALTAVGAATLVPVAATDPVPFTVVPSPVPAWFTTDGAALAPGTVVLALPFAGQTAMGWQAQSGMRFALANGFAVVPAPSGRSEFVDPPGGAAGVLDRLSPDPQSLGMPPEPSSDRDVAEVRAAIARWHVGAVVVTRVGRDPAYAAAFFTAVFGRAPRAAHGSWAWYGAPAGRSWPVGPSTLARCARAPGGVAAAAGCVLAGGSGTAAGPS